MHIGGCRVAAMGGTPALGAGMVLPKLSHHQLHKLANTESPAARELHAAQGRPDEPAPISPQPKVHTPDNSPPWLVSMYMVFSYCLRLQQGALALPAGGAAEEAEHLPAIFPSQAIAALASHSNVQFQRLCACQSLH